MDSGLYDNLAAAFVRGSLAEAGDLDDAGCIALGRERGLKLHRFKRTSGLPRVKRVLGSLRGLAPQSLLDIGSGRGVFLWPLLDAFPGLSVFSLELLKHRCAIGCAVRRGGVANLHPICASGDALPATVGAFDVVTALEVLEHQHDPAPMAREILRASSRAVIASVPSKEDDNPEHVQLFTAESLHQLLTEAGAGSVSIDFVPGHMIAVAMK